MYYLAEALQDVLPDNTPIVSGSSGSAIELFLLALRVKPGQRVFHTTALGAMGFGIAASIGVCMANGRRPVVCVDGDGGFQFNIQELETVSRLQLPIIFFVLNNDGYASIRISQTAFFGSPRIGCNPETGQSMPDIGKVAQAYGLKTDTIRDQSNLYADCGECLPAAARWSAIRSYCRMNFAAPDSPRYSVLMARSSPSRSKTFSLFCRGTSSSQTC